MKENVEMISAYVKYPHGHGGVKDKRSKTKSPNGKGSTRNSAFGDENSFEYYPERPPHTNFQ